MLPADEDRAKCVAFFIGVFPVAPRGTASELSIPNQILQREEACPTHASSWVLAYPCRNAFGHAQVRARLEGCSAIESASFRMNSSRSYAKMVLTLTWCFVGGDQFASPLPASMPPGTECRERMSNSLQASFQYKFNLNSF